MATDRRRRLACAIYARKSTEEGLDQEFNSLDAQREGRGFAWRPRLPRVPASGQPLAPCSAD